MQIGIGRRRSAVMALREILYFIAVLIFDGSICSTTQYGSDDGSFSAA